MWFGEEFRQRVCSVLESNRFKERGRDEPVNWELQVLEVPCLPLLFLPPHHSILLVTVWCSRHWKSSERRQFPKRVTSALRVLIWMIGEWMTENWLTVTVFISSSFWQSFGRTLGPGNLHWRSGAPLKVSPTMLIVSYDFKAPQANGMKHPSLFQSLFCHFCWICQAKIAQSFPQVFDIAIVVSLGNPSLPFISNISPGFKNYQLRWAITAILWLKVSNSQFPSLKWE